jgi:integrase/recombinase XerD
LREAAKTAGISKRVTTHTLRHTFGSIVGASTGSAVAVMNALGHSSLAISRGYIHADREHKEIATQAMSRALAGE